MTVAKTFSRLLLPLALVAALSANAQSIEVASGTYKLDPTHTNVLVQWNHMGFSNPVAHFGISEGTLVYNAEDVSQSSVEVTLPLAALNSFSENFDKHLNSADFFDSAQFPEITFKSTQVVAGAQANLLAVTGDLTVKGTTKPVTLNVTINGAGPHPMAKVPTVGFDANTSFKRSDFGLGAYAPAVSDELKLTITTEGKQEASNK